MVLRRSADPLHQQAGILSLGRILVRKNVNQKLRIDLSQEARVHQRSSFGDRSTRRATRHQWNARGCRGAYRRRAGRSAFPGASDDRHGGWCGNRDSGARFPSDSSRGHGLCGDPDTRNLHLAARCAHCGSAIAFCEPGGAKDEGPSQGQGSEWIRCAPGFAVAQSGGHGRRDCRRQR
jgi:hypothetical protein